MGTFSIWHWLVVLLVVVLVFGSGKLADIGKNVGKAIRGYQSSMREGAPPKSADADSKSAALESSQPAEGAASSSESAAKTTSS